MDQDSLRSLPDIPPIPEGEPQPAWGIATLFPGQGCWSEEEYLRLPTNRLVEFIDGRVEVLPMPTRLHQRIVACLYAALKAFVDSRNLGDVYFAPLPVHLWPGRYREPDLIFVSAGNTRALEGEYLEGADLVMEVVSADDPDRDWNLKRREYARAGIAEYWIVDPFEKRIAVFILEGESYVLHGDFKVGQVAASAMFPDFTIAASDALLGG
jgi:Uma2 family endonuclease